MVAARRNRIQQKIPSRLARAVARILEHTDDVAVALYRHARSTVRVQECLRAVFGQLLHALRIDHRAIAVRCARGIQCFREGFVIRPPPQPQIRRTVLCRFSANCFS